MGNYVFVFRTDPSATPDPSQEAAWMSWFASIGPSIVDSGNRVGKATTVGSNDSASVVGGYTVVKADDLDAAAELAKGCPGLQRGWAVEVGEIVPS